jgi:hypothetical protein
MANDLIMLETMLSYRVYTWPTIYLRVEQKVGNDKSSSKNMVNMVEVYYIQSYNSVRVP